MSEFCPHCAVAVLAVNEYNMRQHPDNWIHITDGKSLDPIVDRIKERIGASGSTMPTPSMMIDDGVFVNVHRGFDHFTTFLKKSAIEPYAKTLNHIF